MDLVIRRVRPDDASGIVHIFNPIISAGIYTVLDAPLTIEGQIAYLEALPDRAIFHVAQRKNDGSIVGFQSMDPFPDPYTHAFDHVGVIGTWVDLASHRQGVAKALFSAMFETAPRKGYEKMFTYIRADNPVALATYKSQGFQIVGRAVRQAKLRGHYIDEMIVERMLSGHR
jgi:L-amino acid N-acyltransferase YncA